MTAQTHEKRKAYCKGWYVKHRTEILAKKKTTRDPAVVRQRNLAWREKHPNYFTERRAKNRENINAKKREKYTANIEVERASRRAYGCTRVRRYASDPAFAILCRLRSRLTDILKTKRVVKTSRTLELAGCTLPELMEHIQSLFLPGMHWNNRDSWHIDHIRPCASFDLTDPEQQKICFHYTNLQPLWQLDNLRKGSRLPEHLR